MSDEQKENVQKDQAENRNCNYDSAWKEVLKKLFKDCFEFFFPEIHDAIDFTKEITFLDKELNEIQPDSSQGDREADILAKVHLRDGSINYICLIIHVEVQSQERSDFMERMFIYYYRAFDKEKKEKIPVISLAILTDDNKNFRPDTFNFSFCGFEIKMKIPMVKILDYKSKPKLKKKLENSTNPMALVVKAQLKSLEVKRLNNEAKFEVENELIKECFRMKYSKEDIRILISFIDWVIRLPEAYKDRVLEIIQQAQEETKMEYVPIWARDIRQEGMDQGKSEGKLEEKQEVAERMINQGFKVETIAKCLDITVEEAKKMTDKLIN